MEKYIYHNPYTFDCQYKIIRSYEEALGYFSGMAISLCTSYFNAESHKNLEACYSNNGTRMVIADEVFSTELVNKNSGGSVFNQGSSKNQLAQCIKKVNVDIDGTSEVPFIGDKNDVLPVLAVMTEGVGGLVATADYHVAANALYLAVPYIFLISQSSLIEAGGIENYRLIHIKKVNNFKKEIINNKKI